MGNESSSPAFAPPAALPVRRAADGKIDGLSLSPGDRRKLPKDACRGDRPLLVGILQAAHRVRSVCVLFGEREQVVAQLGPGSLLSLPGVSLDYLNGCEVFVVRPSELPECAQRVVFAGLIEDEDGGAGNVAAEAFLAVSSSSSVGQAAAGGASCATPSCTPEMELAGRNAELNVLAKMPMLLSSNQHQAHFSLRMFSGDPSSSWQLEATGAPVVLAGGAVSARSLGGPYESVEFLSVPDLGPAQPAPSGSSQVRQLERQLQEEQGKNRRLARSNTEAREWNARLVEKVETKQYQLEVWRRQALIWAKGWDTETVTTMLGAGGWPLTTGDTSMSLVELHSQLGSKLSKELTDPRGHPLEVWASDAHGYKCDVCKTKYPIGSIFYSCRATGYDECSNCYFKRLQKLMFDKLDKNRDGVISQAEFQAAVESPLGEAPIAPPKEPAQSARSEATTTARSARPPQVAALDLSSVQRPDDQPKKKTVNKQPSREGEPSDAGTWESDNANARLETTALAQQAMQVDDDIREITIDLERPFGVLFDNSLTVKAVKENSQGEKLQIHVGYKLVSANGEALQSIAGLESQVSSLRSVGQKQLVIQFSTKLHSARLATGGQPNAARSGGEVDLDHASRSQYATLRGTPQVHSIDPATPRGTPGDRTPITNPRNGVENAAEVIECTLDMSRPWGLLIGDDLYVQDAQEGSQSEQQGIVQGWKVHKLNGQPVRSIHEFKDSVAKLKAGGNTKTVRLSFVPSEEEESDEEEEQGGDTPRNR